MRRLALAIGLCLCVLACRTKVPPPPVAAKNIFILYPDANGHIGGINVANKAGSVDLASAYLAVQIDRDDTAPGAPVVLSKDDADSTFGAVINALPDPEKSLLIYFQPSKDEIAADSRATLEAAPAEIQARHSTDVSVVGHADSTGDPKANYELALRRANKVASELTALGVPAQILSIESRGDADPLVKTPRGVPEARNRRVEILVR